VLFDDQGRLWVKEGTDRVSEPLDYIPQSRWRLVDRKGTLLGVMDLARGEKLIGFSKGMMLLARVLPDDTDVLEGYTYVIR
jgi:hypothetical protein